MPSIPENRPVRMTGTTVRAIYRYTSGAHLDGARRTDAGWVTRGTRPVQAARVTRWSALSRLERAAVRNGSAAAAGAALWGLQAHTAATEQTLTSLTAGAAVVTGYRGAEWALNLRHYRDWVRPLHLALEGPLGLPEGVLPASYLHIPRDYPGRAEVGRIDLPAAFTGSDGAASTVAQIVKTKLGLSDATVTFKLEGRRPHLLIRQTPRPPAKVLFAADEVRELVAAASESAPLIGVGPQGVRVSVDLDAESPHILVSASTGGGKSVITRTMATQMLHNGSQFVMLDFKRHSHKWARGLPNVAYCRDIGDIHDALVTLGEEGHRRNIVVDDWEGEEGKEPVGPRMGILLEEANATISKLKRYWTAIRDPKTDPKESPAIDALREILFMGRAVKMHVFLVAQSATAAALGGPEVRECFATRILARYTRNAWLMLVPEVHPIPRSTRHVGRAQVVLGGVASETQVAFFTSAEAREWAASGTLAPPLDLDGLGGPVTGSQGHSAPVSLEKEPVTGLRSPPAGRGRRGSPPGPGGPLRGSQGRHSDGLPEVRAGRSPARPRIPRPGREAWPRNALRAGGLAALGAQPPQQHGSRRRRLMSALSAESPFGSVPSGPDLNSMRTGPHRPGLHIVCPERDDRPNTAAADYYCPCGASDSGRGYVQAAAIISQWTAHRAQCRFGESDPGRAPSAPATGRPHKGVRRVERRDRPRPVGSHRPPIAQSPWNAARTPLCGRPGRFPGPTPRALPENVSERHVRPSTAPPERTVAMTRARDYDPTASTTTACRPTPTASRPPTLPPAGSSGPAGLRPGRPAGRRTDRVAPRRPGRLPLSPRPRPPRPALHPGPPPRARPRQRGPPPVPDVPR